MISGGASALPRGRICRPTQTKKKIEREQVFYNTASYRYKQDGSVRAPLQPCMHFEKRENNNFWCSI